MAQVVVNGTATSEGIVVNGVVNLGPKGAPGTRWYTGQGVPGAGLGVEFDFYLDTDTGDVYEKDASAWNLVDNIQGQPGPKGDPGVVDSDTTGITGANTVPNIVRISKADYEALPDPATNFPDTVFIVEGDILASEVPTDTTNFNGHLSPLEDTVQKALDTLDNLTIPDPLVGQDLVDEIDTATGSTDWRTATGGGAANVEAISQDDYDLIGSPSGLYFIVPDTGYHPRTQAVIDYAVSQSIDLPPDPYLVALDTMMRTIANYNNEALFNTGDIMRIYAYDGIAQDFVRINLLDPGNRDLTVLNDGPIHVPNSGCQHNPANGSMYSCEAMSTWPNITKGDEMYVGYWDVPGVEFPSFGGRDGVSEFRLIYINRNNGSEGSLLRLDSLFDPPLNGDLTRVGPNGTKGGAWMVNGTEREYYVEGNLVYTDTPAGIDELPSNPWGEIGWRNNNAWVNSGDHIQTALYVGRRDVVGQVVLNDAFAQYLTDIKLI
jgi:hypothetical protein